MFKLKTYYEKEKLPTIYSPNAHLKSLSQKKKINYQNIFDQTFSNGIYDLNKNNLEKIKILLKEMDGKEKFNSVHNKVMTIYAKNRTKNNNDNSYNYNNQRTRYKSYNNQTNISNSKTHFKNSALNETNIAFNVNYQNFINNLKKKKLNLKTSQTKEISKDFDINKLRPLMLKKPWIIARISFSLYLKKSTTTRIIRGTTIKNRS